MNGTHDHTRPFGVYGNCSDETTGSHGHVGIDDALERINSLEQELGQIRADLTKIRSDLSYLETRVSNCAEEFHDHEYAQEHHTHH